MIDLHNLLVQVHIQQTLATPGERVSCGDACRLVLIKWSGGSQGQTGNTAVIRSEAASDPWYPLILGHSRVFTWGAQISRWRVSGEVMLHQRSSNTIFINISRAKTDQIYPDNIIIGYPSTLQVGGKKKRAWGDSNIVGFYNCFLFHFVCVNVSFIMIEVPILSLPSL